MIYLLFFVLLISAIPCNGMLRTLNGIREDEKPNYFYERGTLAAEKFAALFDEDCLVTDAFRDDRTFCEILSEMRRANGKMQENSNGLFYARIYAAAFNSCMQPGRLSGLLHYQVSKGGAQIGSRKIQILMRAAHYQSCLGAMVRLASVKSDAEFGDVVRALRTNYNEFCELLKYYYQFGERFGTTYMPTLLSSVPLEGLEAIRAIKKEFVQSFSLQCEAMLSFDSVTEAAYRENWAYIHAFSKGVLSAMKITDLEAHLASVEQSAANMLWIKTLIYIDRA